MAHAARTLGRHPPNPSLAASRPAPPPPPPAHRPDAPPRAAQDTAWPTCGDRNDPGKMTRCQCKQAAQNEVHHANEAVFKTKRISRQDSSDKYRMHRSSGGTYSKPDARVKLIPAEDITYVRHGKPFGRTVASGGLQKRHCKRSVTPPSSCKVSLVRSTSLTQKPTPPASAVVASCLSPKRLETAENGHSLVGGYITSSLTTQIASLKNRPSASCKAVLSQPSGTSLITAPKNLSSKESREAFVRICSSSILHCQDQSSAIPPSGLLKEAVISPISPSSVHVLAAHSSEVPLSTKAKPSSKSVWTPDNGKLCSTSCNSATFQCQRIRSAAARIVQKEPTLEPTLLSPTSVLSERFTEVYPDTRSRPSSRLNLFDGKSKAASLQCETIIPPTRSPQSTAPAQCVELSTDFEAVPSSKSHISNEKQTNQEASINCNTSSGTPVILHTKLHKKHYQPEACWKGKFEVIGELTRNCDGLEAHFPFEIFVKVYEASKQMPEILKLEALPLSRLWPKMFKMKPPDGQDIGLCFISSLQRPNRNFDHLLENTASHIGLQANIGTTELLIFSSKLLTQDYRTKGGKFYFWGVFRKHLRKKQHRSNNHTNNAEISNTSLSNGDSCDRSEEIGVNFDLTEGKEAKSDKCEIDINLDTRVSEEMERDKYKVIGKILDVTGDRGTDRANECLAMLKTPNSNAAASCTASAVSFFSGRHSPDSTDFPCQSATRAADSDLVLELDTPPGFPLDVPPGFTKAHCRFRTGETAECINSSPSLVLDTPLGSLDVPTGFTKAHYQLHTGETAESYINSSPSLVLDTPPGFPLDIPPGFSEAHRRLPTITSDGSEAGVSIPGSEKRSLIEFSLNVTRPVQTVVLPGFTRLHSVKKDPGLPAVCKAIEKIKPIGKVDEMKIKHEVKVEVEERAEDNTSTLSKCTPRNCT